MTTEENQENDESCITVIDNHTGNVSIISCEELDKDTDTAQMVEASSDVVEEVLAPARVYRNMASNRFLSRRLLNCRTSSRRTLVEVYLCSRCQVEFTNRSEHETHESVCRFDQRSNELLTDTYIPPNMEDFVAQLGLVAFNSSKGHDCHAGEAKEEVECIVVVIDDVIINDDDMPLSALLPPTPKTPRLLLPQSSRDGIASPSRTEAGVNFMRGGQGAGGDSRRTTDSVDSVVDSKSVIASSGSKSLLTVDLSSPLGQRVRKHIATQLRSSNQPQVASVVRHMSTDGLVDSVIAYEQFCRNEKCLASDRARRIGDNVFPIKFRRLRSSHAKYYHRYKFTRMDRRRFCLAFDRGGLDEESFRLKRALKKCAVSLRKLTSGDIVDWSRSSELRLEDDAYNRKIAAMNLQRPQILYRSVATARSSRTTIKSNTPTPNFNGIRPPIRFHSGYKARAGARSEYSRPPRTVRPVSQSSARFSQSLPSGGFNHYKIKGGVMKKVVAPKPRASRSGDVIAISSDDSDEETNNGRQTNGKHNADSGDTLLNSSQKMSALLFRCHVCNAEITCRSGAHHLIQVHYKEMHNIHNIELVKQTGPNGESLLNVMEMPIKTSVAASVTNHVAAPRSIATRHNGALTKHPNILSHKPTPLQPTNSARGYLPSSHSFSLLRQELVPRNYAAGNSASDVTLCVRPVSLVGDNEVICLD